MSVEGDTTMLYYSIDHPDPDNNFTVSVVPINGVGPGEDVIKFFQIRISIIITTKGKFILHYKVCSNKIIVFFHSLPIQYAPSMSHISTGMLRIISFQLCMCPTFSLLHNCTLICIISSIFIKYLILSPHQIAVDNQISSV